MTEELDINDVKRCFASLGYQVVAEARDPIIGWQLYSVIDAKTKTNVQTNLIFYGQPNNDIINWTVDELRYVLKKAIKFWTPWMGEAKTDVIEGGILSTSYCSFPRAEKSNPFKDMSPHEMLIKADMISDPFIQLNPLSKQ